MSVADGLDINTAILGSPDIVAQNLYGVWNQWSTARNSMLDQWSEIQRYVWATSTRDTTNETMTDWSNTTHRPKLANLYDTLTINYDAALFPNDDWLTWEGADEESASITKAKTVEAYMRTKHQLRSSGFRNTMRKLESDWVIFGNAFAQVEYVREFATDPESGERILGYTGPRVVRIDPRDIVFNPLAESFAKSPKMIRTLYTIADLHRIVEDNPDKQYFQDILETALSNRGRIRQFNQGDIDKELQLSFDGFGTPSQYFNSGLVEVIEFYGDLFIEGAVDGREYRKNHVITMVDRWKSIRDEPINTWTGRPHIYHVGWRGRTDNIWSQGPLDNLVGMQYRIDHLENARADAFDQMLDPDIVFSGDVEDIMQVGGAKHYFIPEGGNVDYLRPETTVLNADLQIRELTDSMELFALSPREALGFRTPGEKTLGEVQELANAASRSFQHKVNIFQEFVEEISNGELEVSVRNLDGVDVIQVVDDDNGAVEFRSITKEDITSSGRLVPIGARHFARNTQLVQNLQQLQAGPLADPEVAMHFSSIGLAKMYQELMDMKTGNKKLVEPFVRIEERLEAQRLSQVAEDQALEESVTDPSGDLGGLNEQEQQGDSLPPAAEGFAG
jgi:hypothetical protein